MNQKFKYQLLLLIAVSTIIFGLLSTDASAADTPQIDTLAAEIKQIIRNLDRGDFNEKDLTAWNKKTIQAKSAASLCVSDAEVSLKQIQESIDALGEKVDGETSEVTIKRKNFLKQKEAIDIQLAKCNLYILTSDEAGAHISEAEKYYFKEKYLARGPNTFELLIEYIRNPITLFTRSGEFVWKYAGLRLLTPEQWIPALILVSLFVIFSLWLGRRLNYLKQASVWHEKFSERLLHAIITTGTHYLPWIVGTAISATLLQLFTSDITPKPFITQAAFALVLYFTAIVMIRMLFAPVAPATLFMPFTPEIAIRLSRRLQILSMLGLIGYLAFYTEFAGTMIEQNLLLLRDIFSLIFVLNIVWTLGVLLKSPKLPKLRWITTAVIGFMILSLIAEGFGYRNLAYSGRRGVLATFIVFMLFIGVSKLFRDMFNALDEGDYGWCRKLHTTLGVPAGQKIPGLIWLRLFTTIMIWGGFAYIIIIAWDYTGSIIEHIRNYVINGFELGQFRFVPSRILWALLIFGLIVTLSSWIRSQLENNWLKMTTMGLGARDALVTITGYVLFLVAIFAGLSAAGFDFSNIAIIAGALSVGIGFGLQNIVNNFVSGLILLFERPIRKGDWIIVGTTEGYVKDIRIRSTIIQTFDRSDVIVPNSELISGQVTNLMLYDVRGRAIIPIGVAYGSDTEKVQQLLTAIVEKHGNVVNDGTSPDPVVLFRGFGESSLDFEIRAHLFNVDSRLKTISDINFAIDKAFRENNIEIPFPQRDLHIRSVPETGLPI
jgi:potassium efflux system protein